jgi:hypothetical protein
MVPNQSSAGLTFIASKLPASLLVGNSQIYHMCNQEEIRFCSHAPVSLPMALCYIDLIDLDYPTWFGKVARLKGVNYEDTAGVGCPYGNGPWDEC